MSLYSQRGSECLQGQNVFWPCDGRRKKDAASETLCAKWEEGREAESDEREEDEDDECEDSSSLEDSEKESLKEVEESEEEESEEEEKSDDLLLFLPLAIPETMQEGQALGKARHFNYNLPHGVKT